MDQDTTLSQDDINQLLMWLPGWWYKDNKIGKTFKFGSFKEAMSFIVRVAMEAEEHKHHPRIFSNYRTVMLLLTTHDVGEKVTQRDVKLAQAIERFNWVGGLSSSLPGDAPNEDAAQEPATNMPGQDEAQSAKTIPPGLRGGHSS